MTARFIVRPGHSIEGAIRVPGDKSISHRALMLGSIAEGATHISGFLPGADCLATMAAIRAMGITVDEHDTTTLTVHGRGPDGWQPPSTPLDMGNSGTAMRLFMGLLAARPFESTLTGDRSLGQRPMERVAAPLRSMGARIETQDGKPPIRISGQPGLHGIRYEMPVASAQVKSAILLAGLSAAGETSVTEPSVTRDHTERMLARFGSPTERHGATVTVRGGTRLRGASIEVPSDLSSATFPILAACLARTGELVLDRVGLNPTRTGILEILRLMGADIRIEDFDDRSAEPAGRLIVRPSALRGIDIPVELVPLAIDEFPAIFVAAAVADGTTVIRGAEELRHKESDRITVMADALKALGARIQELPDGARITGGRLTGGTIDSHGDHRVAMSIAVGALRADAPVTILDTANVATSYPGFVGQARSIGLDIESTDG